MKKDVMLNQHRTGVHSDIDINSDKENRKPPQSYDRSEMSKDEHNPNPKNVRRNG